MEFQLKVHAHARNVRISVSAQQLVNTGDYNNIRRSVGIEADVLECDGETEATRDERLREVFVSLHDSVTSMLAAAIGQAVPIDHELASRARVRAWEAHRAERRAYREARERRYQDAVESLSLQTKACADCGVMRNRHGTPYRCDHHEESFQAIREEFGPKSDEDVPY